MGRVAAWGVRLAVAFALLRAVLPPQALATLGEARTVYTQQPHVCVHTRLVDEVFEWKILRSLELVREMGASTIVEFFPWAYYEPAEGRYDWSRPDMILRFARNQGLKVIARMGFVPAWAQGKNAVNPTLNTLPETSYPAFARFVAAFAQRYSDVVEGVIVWNEPNLAFEWGYRQVDPAAYTRLLAATYEAVKAAAPGVRVYGGALAPTLEPQGSANGLNDLDYLEAMLRAGAGQYMDALAVHTYGFNLPADAPPARETLNFRRAELLQAVLSSAGYPSMPVAITESGWNDHPRWQYGVRPAQRIQYTLDAFRWADERWPWAEVVCAWVFRYPAPTYSYPDNFTFAGTNFELKPIYYAVRAYTRGEPLEDALWLPPPSADSP
jgi:hypothetical protein